MWSHCVFVAALQVVAPPSPPAPPVASLYDAPAETFARQSRADAVTLRRLAEGLARTRGEIEKRPDLLRGDKARPLSPSEKKELLTAWAALRDHVVALEVIRQRYWDFVAVAPSEDRHLVGYVLTHAALTAELAHGLAFTALSQGKDELEVLLDEGSPDLGLPRRAYADFKLQVVHAGTSTQLLSGEAYRRLVAPRLRARFPAEDRDFPWLVDAMKRNGDLARAALKKRGGKLFLKNALDIVKDGARRAIFPVQAAVAEWFGDTRVHRVGRFLVSREQALALAARLQPGDIVVARQNWFLSNIGLPGFWPHAELYVGTPAELAAAFDGDAAVAAYLAQQPGAPKTLAAHLAAAFPDKWRAYTGKDAHGDPFRIIESISEGVSFTGIEHGMRVDYVAAMRPRLGKVDKARAIVRAFEYQGRPYDFDFDFFSDRSLVCTELVCKAFAPDREGQGLKIELVDVAGRRTLPANELVRQFDAAYDGKERQLDFVGFLDGREKDGKAVEADLAAFRHSHRRPKWDIVQD